MGKFVIEPIKGEDHEGRQWGWEIKRDGYPFLRVTMGGTGSCWNVEDAEGCVFPHAEQDQIHICNLDEWIEALTMLRDSDVHKANVERWQ